MQPLRSTFTDSFTILSILNTYKIWHHDFPMTLVHIFHYRTDQSSLLEYPICKALSTKYVSVLSGPIYFKKSPRQFHCPNNWPLRHLYFRSCVSIHRFYHDYRQTRASNSFQCVLVYSRPLTLVHNVQKFITYSNSNHEHFRSFLIIVLCHSTHLLLNWNQNFWTYF